MLRLHVLYRLRRSSRSTLSTQCSTCSTLDTRDRFLMLNTQCPTLNTQTLNARLLILDLDTRCSTLNTRVGLLVKEIGILPRRSVAAEIGLADTRGGPNNCDTDAGTDVVVQECELAGQVRLSGPMDADDVSLSVASSQRSLHNSIG
jgi:hypothetical protein